MSRFDTIKFERTTVIQKEGMEINCFIAGVNSGEYGLPYVIAIRTWARKWIFSKFFYSEMKLNIDQVRRLKEECDKVINWYEENKPGKSGSLRGVKK